MSLFGRGTLLWPERPFVISPPCRQMAPWCHEQEAVGRMLTGLAGIREAAAAAITRPTWRYTLLELSCVSDTLRAPTANPWQLNGKSIFL